MTKVAILIDGGYLLKRLPSVRPDVNTANVESVAKSIEDLIRGHLDQLKKVHDVSNIFQLLYRSFYYDATPYDHKAHLPASGKPFDYAKSPQAHFRKNLFNHLHGRPNLAVRLGYVRKNSNHSWILNAEKQRQILKGEIEVGELVDEDFLPAFRQKGVDMRIGIDITSITLKRQANIIVLVSGEDDGVGSFFSSAARVACSSFSTRSGRKYPMNSSNPSRIHRRHESLIGNRRAHIRPLFFAFRQFYLFGFNVLIGNYA